MKDIQYTTHQYVLKLLEKSIAKHQGDSEFANVVRETLYEISTLVLKNSRKYK